MMISRRVASLIIAALACSCSTHPAVDDQTKAQYHLQIGTSHFMRGNYPQALASLLEAERLDPSEPTIQNNLGLTYFVREKYDDAEVHFKKALKIKANYTDARNNLGQLYIKVGLYAKAITELEIASTDLTYEQPEKSWAGLGQAYFLSKQYQRAKVAFQNSLKVRRESCFTMNYYGRTLFELQNFKAAAESLDRAVQLCAQGGVDEPRFYSGLSFYKLGDVEQARARFTELVKLTPESRYAKEAKELLGMLQ